MIIRPTNEDLAIRLHGPCQKSSAAWRGLESMLRGDRRDTDIMTVLACSNRLERRALQANAAWSSI